MKILIYGSSILRKSVCITFCVLFTLNLYAQSQVAVLKVDYLSYNFEGGHIVDVDSLAQPSDTIPFVTFYESPSDFGWITFTIGDDTIFDASMIWMGTGKIYFPDSFIYQFPFNQGDATISKPINTSYINTNPSFDITYPDLLNSADSAWNSISSLSITNHFSNSRMLVNMYLYRGDPGIDERTFKWIIFLYKDDKIKGNINTPVVNNLSLYPNPSKTNIILDSKLENSEYNIYDSQGKKVKSGIYDTRIKIDHLNFGIYFIEVISESKVWRTRFFRN